MTWLRLLRGEFRKLTTTKMPWAFLAVLGVIAVTNAIAVVIGTDTDGTKKFIATGVAQQSLVAFASNAMMIAGLFGAIAVAREYTHATVVPMFLAAPRRHRAVLAQFTAVLLGGAVLGLIGAGLTIFAVALALPATGYAFMISAGGVAQVLAASAFAGAAGATLGPGAGAVVRNMGGAVTAAVLLLIVLPPIVVQLANDAVSWVPATLTNVASGVANNVATAAAFAAFAAWALIPALIGLFAVTHRDVV